VVTPGTAPFVEGVSLLWLLFPCAAFATGLGFLWLIRRRKEDPDEPRVP
jgi:hypothetical protein